MEQISHVELTTTRGSTSQASEEGDAGRTLWQNVQRYRKVVWITFGVASVILLYGYDNVVVGTVSGMPKFQYVYFMLCLFFHRHGIGAFELCF